MLKKQESMPKTAEIGDSEEEMEGNTLQTEKLPAIPEIEEETQSGEIAEQAEDQPINAIEPKQIPLPVTGNGPVKSGNKPVMDPQQNIPWLVPIGHGTNIPAEDEYEAAKQLVAFKEKMWNKEWPTCYDYMQDEKLARMFIKEYIKEGLLPKNFDIFTIFPLRNPCDF